MREIFHRNKAQFRRNNCVYFKKLQRNCGEKDPQSAAGALNQCFLSFELDKVDQQIQKFTNLPTRTESAMEQMLELAAKKEHLQTQLAVYENNSKEAEQKAETGRALAEILGSTTAEIQAKINAKILEYSGNIATSNSKAPMLHLTSKIINTV